MLILLFANSGGSAICQEACSCDLESNYPDVHLPLRAAVQFVDGQTSSGVLGNLRFVSVTDGVKVLACCMGHVSSALPLCSQCVQFADAKNRDSWIALLLLSMQSLDACFSAQLGEFASKAEGVTRLRGTQVTAKDIIAGMPKTSTESIKTDCDPGIRWMLQRTLATPPTFWLPRSLGLSGVTIHVYTPLAEHSGMTARSLLSASSSAVGKWHTVSVLPACGPRIPEVVNRVVQEYMENRVYPADSTTLQTVEVSCPPILAGRQVVQRSFGTLTRLSDAHGCVAILRLEHVDCSPNPPVVASFAVQPVPIDTASSSVQIAQAVTRAIDVFFNALVPASSPVALLRSSSTRFHVGADRSSLHLDFNQLGVTQSVEAGLQPQPDGEAFASETLDRIASFALSAATSRSGIEGLAVLGVAGAVDDIDGFELTARTEVPRYLPSDPTLLPERPQGDRPPMDKSIAVKQRPGRQIRKPRGVPSADAITYLSSSSEDAGH